jgi:hypothetical protein
MTMGGTNSRATLFQVICGGLFEQGGNHNQLVFARCASTCRRDQRARNASFFGLMILLLGELGMGAARHAKVIEEAPPAH